MSLKFVGDRHGFYLYPWYINDLATTSDVKKLVGMNLDSAFIHIKEEFVSIFMDDRSINEIGRKVLDKILKDRDYYRRVSRNILELDRRMDRFCHKLNRADVGRLSDRQLLNIYKDYTRRLREFRSWGWIPNFIDGAFISFLTDHIRKELGDFFQWKKTTEEMSRYYSLFSSAEKMSEVRKEELMRLKLIISSKKSKAGREALELILSGRGEEAVGKFPQMKKKLEAHLKEFGYLTYAYVGPPMSLDYLLENVRNDLQKGDVATQKRMLEQHYREIKRQKKELSKELGLTRELAYLFEVSAEMMFMKDFRKGAYMKSYLAMDKVMAEIAKRLGMTMKEVKYLVLEEVEAAFFGKKEQYRRLSQKRSKECCYIAQSGQLEISEGVKARKLFEKVKEQDVSRDGGKEEELRGKTAFGGKVSGTVKIVLTVKDVPKVLPGDILVSSSTNPDLIIAMKKAAAFVTDFGGITSHAAIVSRELKKPCVVGTRVATHVLKDGDEVEVDADKGTVRIIQKKK